jgi:hypothetical protein
MTRQQFYSLIAKNEGKKKPISIGNAREAGSIALKVLAVLYESDYASFWKLLKIKNYL